jgi:DNA polymerase III delta prime subunit
MSDKNQLLDLLVRAFDKGRLGHALILACGRPEAPEFQVFAREFVALLMCPERKADSASCGRCDSCKMILSSGFESTHPDGVWLKPANPVGGYSVDEVRTLLSSFSLQRALAKNRVAVIFDAEALSGGGGGAANALLKLLEEPRPNTFLLLVSSNPEGLMATIRSRCQLFRFALAGGHENKLSKDLEDSWSGLIQWLRAGAPALAAAKAVATPADDDTFWSERETAIAELEKLHEGLWAALRSEWARFERVQGRSVLDFFVRLEELTAAVRGYANGPLQWLSFRSDVRMGL